MNLIRPAVLTCFLVGVALGACGKGNEAGDDLETKCEAMCERLFGAGFQGCGHDDATSDKCVPECMEHVDKGDSTIADVDCAINARSCVAWRKCGDLL
jgi:hypothetical protein